MSCFPIHPLWATPVASDERRWSLRRWVFHRPMWWATALPWVPVPRCQWTKWTEKGLPNLPLPMDPLPHSQVRWVLSTLLRKRRGSGPVVLEKAEVDPYRASPGNSPGPCYLLSFVPGRLPGQPMWWPAAKFWLPTWHPQRRHWLGHWLGPSVVTKGVLDTTGSGRQLGDDLGFLRFHAATLLGDMQLVGR